MILRLVKAEDVLIVAAAIYLAAVLAAGGVLPRLSINLIMAMLFGMFGVAGVNSLNQIHDEKIDAINKPQRPLPANRLSKKSVKIISISLLVLGAFCAVFLFFALSHIYIILGLLGLLTSLLYTLPATRFKRFTFLSTGIMGFGYGPFIFIAGWTVLREPYAAPIWILTFLYFHEVFILITKDYRDVEGDEKYGMRTLPVVLGRARSAAINYGMYILPFIGVTILALSGRIDFEPFILFITGTFTGIPMFWFCSRPDIYHNIAGYYTYVVVFIIIRIILAFTVNV